MDDGLKTRSPGSTDVPRAISALRFQSRTRITWQADSAATDRRAAARLTDGGLATAVALAARLASALALAAALAGLLAGAGNSEQFIHLE